MHIILSIVIALLAIGIVMAFMSWVIRGFKYVAIVLLAIVAGVPALAGKSTHVLSRWARMSFAADPALCLAALLPVFGFAAEGRLPISIAFGVTAGLAMATMSARLYSVVATRNLGWNSAVREQRVAYDLVSHVASWLAAVAFVAFLLATPALDSPSPGPWWIYSGWCYWAMGAGLQVFATVRHVQLAAFAAAVERAIPRRNGTALSQVVRDMTERYPALGEDVDALVRIHVAFATAEGRLVEIELNGSRRLFQADLFRDGTQAISEALLPGVRYPEAMIGKSVRTWFDLGQQDAIDLLTHFARVGQVYQFEDGHYFIPYVSSAHLDICAGCGVAQWVQLRDGGESSREAVVWFCGDLCEQTEKGCLDIHRQEPASFVNDAISTGFTLMGGTDAWVENHKLFAAGGQGHGFAAEKGNTLLDRLLGRSARVIGGDNARNGPDRIVDGQLLQTKYCRSPGKTVAQAFDAKGGGFYRYFAPDGSLIRLEVPADQYPQAVREMERRIAAGKIPGVTDPAEAKRIVVRGHLTYEQSRNIIKFGRLESLAFDLADGAVIGLGAASISFTLSATLIYLRGVDAKSAVQAAAWQAGKVGLVSAGSYVAVQQVHRLAPVQSVLRCIDVSGMPPTLCELLQNGLGVETTKALNKALGGAAVSSVVAVGLATAPDIYRMIRREVTIAKLKRTVVTAGAGAVGAFVGSVVGAAAGAPAGPLGLFVGRASGGVVGALAGTMTAEWFFADQRDREQAVANERFQAHLAYLALTFAMTEQEIRVVVRNFLSISGKDTHQKILAGKLEGRAYLNSLLKPIAVGVVKQRDYRNLERRGDHDPSATPLEVAVGN